MTVVVEATTAQHGNCTGIFLIRFLRLSHASTHQRLPLGAKSLKVAQTAFREPRKPKNTKWRVLLNN